MNNLSWLLYFAGVCDNVQGTFIFFSIVCGIASLGFGLGWGMSFDEYNKDAHDRCGIVLFRYLLPGVILCSLLSAFIPSEKTIYLIAASQTGDKALHTETGQKAIAAIDRYLDSVGAPEAADENTQTSK